MGPVWVPEENLIKTFYTDISSCVLSNGFTTDLFLVRRGVRQGDPLSPLLFILALEMLVCQIRNDQSVKGIIAKDEQIQLTLFADDMTCFARDVRSHHQLYFASIFKILSSPSK